MISNQRNYLQVCLSDVGDVFQKKYGRALDLKAIEKSVKHLRRDTPLSYSDLRYFEAPDHWWFQKFWVFPSEEEVTPGLKRRWFNFWKLPKDERQVIRSLLEVFRSIELVSIVLRFIKPEDYGIISPLVEKILDVRRGGNAVETYQNYLADIRRIRDEEKYGLDRAGDVDSALWVLHERCFGTYRDPAIERDYYGDPFMVRLRIHNLWGHVLRKHSYGDLAKALFDIDLHLAAQLGGIAFEEMVRETAEQAKQIKVEELDLRALIDTLYEKRIIDQITLGKWHAARRTRNKAIHPKSRSTVNHGEVERLIRILDENA